MDHNYNHQKITMMIHGIPKTLDNFGPKLFNDSRIKPSPRATGQRTGRFSAAVGPAPGVHSKGVFGVQEPGENIHRLIGYGDMVGLVTSVRLILDCCLFCWLPILFGGNLIYNATVI